MFDSRFSDTSDAGLIAAIAEHAAAEAAAAAGRLAAVAELVHRRCGDDQRGTLGLRRMGFRRRGRYRRRLASATAAPRVRCICPWHCDFAFPKWRHCSSTGSSVPASYRRSRGEPSWSRTPTPGHSSTRPSPSTPDAGMRCPNTSSTSPSISGSTGTTRVRCGVPVPAPRTATCRSAGRTRGRHHLVVGSPASHRRHHPAAPTRGDGARGLRRRSAIHGRTPSRCARDPGRRRPGTSAASAGPECPASGPDPAPPAS